MPQKTLLLVFIHGFKGTDHTFSTFPSDLRALLAHTFPSLNVRSAIYPQYDTRGDLTTAVEKFKDWLQNRVIDLEVENRAPSPTVAPSVRVVLCGHSMGGIVAAETVLRIVAEGVAPSDSGGGNDATTAEEEASMKEGSGVLFPFVQAVVAFDTPYLGISPGVLAHGAEEQLNHASTAYKAYDSASQFFGWGSPRSGTPASVPDASKALPAGDGAGSGGGWGKWGKVAAFGGAAAAIAGAAGAAYLNRNQIAQGLNWAGSHLEFVGVLAKGADLQKRVERMVELDRTRGIGFADFYTALGEKVTSQTKYSGSVLGADRTFCVVPKASRAESPTGSKRDAPSSSERPEPKRRKGESELDGEMTDGEQVEEFAQDPTKSKGHWVKCVNEAVSDELKAHTSMFSAKTNSNYHVMVPQVRDLIEGWIDRDWCESSVAESADANARGGAEEAQEDLLG